RPDRGLRVEQPVQVTARVSDLCGDQRVPRSRGDRQGRRLPALREAVRLPQKRGRAPGIWGHRSPEPGVNCAPREVRIQTSRSLHRAGTEVWPLLGRRLVRETAECGVYLAGVGLTGLRPEYLQPDILRRIFHLEYSGTRGGSFPAGALDPAATGLEDYASLRSPLGPS